MGREALDSPQINAQALAIYLSISHCPSPDPPSLPAVLRAAHTSEYHVRYGDHTAGKQLLFPGGSQKTRQRPSARKHRSISVQHGLLITHYRDHRWRAPT